MGHTSLDQPRPVECKPVRRPEPLHARRTARVRFVRMPKHDFLSPKAIGNRIKSKGLQKLRWYCQMCQKQCRDENGFKCHTMSESHMRQMEMFSQNSKSFMDEFSTEFEGGMMEIIARKARSKRMSANQIYKEYISDKQHFHMNATIWETLTDFVMYLGREGKCEVDETEKGWFVTYIDRDPEKLRQIEERAKRERTELDAEERQLRDIERLVKRARETGEDQVAEATELQRGEGDAPIKIGIGGGGGALGKARMKEGRAACGLFGDGDDEATAAPSGGGGGNSSGGGDVPTTLPSGQTPRPSRPGTKYSVRGFPHFDHSHISAWP